jgi:hypothetical protein
MNRILLHAAYGRVYNTASEAEKDWADGKDFKIVNGPYTSIRDEEQLKEDFGSIVIAYAINSEGHREVTI